MDKQYLAYNLLEKDFMKICEYIDPRDDNKNVYSHRIYEVFLRICTEFEAICKDRLVQFKYPGKSDPNNFKICDYEKLYSDPSYNGQALLDREILLKVWQPSAKRLQPFADWKNKKPLSWYQAYNAVKHNRDTHFNLASLDNLTVSFAGLFSMLVTSYGWDFFDPFSVKKFRGSNSLTGTTVNNCLFSTIP